MFKFEKAIILYSFNVASQKLFSEKENISILFWLLKHFNIDKSAFKKPVAFITLLNNK